MMERIADVFGQRLEIGADGNDCDDVHRQLAALPTGTTDRSGSDRVDFPHEKQPRTRSLGPRSARPFRDFSAGALEEHLQPLHPMPRCSGASKCTRRKNSPNAGSPNCCESMMLHPPWNSTPKRHKHNALRIRTGDGRQTLVGLVSILPYSQCAGFLEASDCQRPHDLFDPRMLIDSHKASTELSSSKYQGRRGSEHRGSARLGGLKPNCPKGSRRLKNSPKTRVSKWQVLGIEDCARWRGQSPTWLRL